MKTHSVTLLDALLIPLSQLIPHLFASIPVFMMLKQEVH